MRWYVHEDIARRILSTLSYEQAAGFPIAFRTAHAALVQRIPLAKGQTLLVLGAAGSSGSAAIQLAKALGATVIAVAGSQRQRDFCTRIGADRDHKVSCTSLRDLPELMPGGAERLEERFCEPLVRVDDDIAVVWAHHDFLVDGKVHHWGTNILSFLRQGGRWRVSAVVDNGRTGARPDGWERGSTTA